MNLKLRYNAQNISYCFNYAPGWDRLLKTCKGLQVKLTLSADKVSPALSF
jgi:hypothetical protein